MLHWKTYLGMELYISFKTTLWCLHVLPLLHSHSGNPCLMWYKHASMLVFWQKFFCRCWYAEEGSEKRLYILFSILFRTFLDSMVSSGHAWFVVLFLWTHNFTLLQPLCFHSFSYSIPSWCKNYQEAYSVAQEIECKRALLIVLSWTKQQLLKDVEV